MASCLGRCLGSLAFIDLNLSDADSEIMPELGPKLPIQSKASQTNADHNNCMVNPKPRVP
eukprot:4515926-Amphidinium_carterae.2